MKEIEERSALGANPINGNNILHGLFSGAYIPWGKEQPLPPSELEREIQDTFHTAVTEPSSHLLCSNGEHATPLQLVPKDNTDVQNVVAREVIRFCIDRLRNIASPETLEDNQQHVHAIFENALSIDHFRAAFVKQANTSGLRLMKTVAIHGTPEMVDLLHKNEISLTVKDPPIYPYPLSAALEDSQYGRPNKPTAARIVTHLQGTLSDKDLAEQYVRAIFFSGPRYRFLPTAAKFLLPHITAEQLVSTIEPENIFAFDILLNKEVPTAFVKQLIDIFDNVNIELPDASSLLLHIMRSQRKDKDELARHLIEKKANINFADSRGETALHVACWLYNSTLYEELLTKGADVTAVTRDQQTPLHYAADRGNSAATELLLSNGASVAALDSKNRSALHLAGKSGDVETFNLLVTAGAEKRAHDSKDRLPVFYLVRELAYYGDESLPEQYQDDFLVEPSNLTYRNKKGKTFVHLAAEDGNFPLLQFLFDSRMSLDTRDQKGRTPAHLAAREKNFSSLLFLLNLGASPDIEDSKKRTPIYEAAKHIVLEGGGDLDGNVRERLPRHQTDDFNAIVCNGKALVHFAAATGDLAMLKYIKRSGADLNLPDEDGKTCGHILIERGHISELAGFATLGVDFEIPDHTGQTALEIITSKGKKINGLKYTPYLASRSESFSAARERLQPLMEAPLEYMRAVYGYLFEGIERANLQYLLDAPIEDLYQKMDNGDFDDTPSSAKIVDLLLGRGNATTESAFQLILRNSGFSSIEAADGKKLTPKDLRLMVVMMTEELIREQLQAMEVGQDRIVGSLSAEDIKRLEEIQKEDVSGGLGTDEANRALREHFRRKDNVRVYHVGGDSSQDNEWNLVAQLKEQGFNQAQRYHVFILPTFDLEVGHARAIVIDNEARTIRYMDSKGEDLPERHRKALDNFLHYDLTTAPVRKQQNQWECVVHATRNIMDEVDGIPHSLEPMNIQQQLLEVYKLAIANQQRRGELGIFRNELTPKLAPKSRSPSRDQMMEVFQSLNTEIAKNPSSQYIPSREEFLDVFCETHPDNRFARNLRDEGLPTRDDREVVASDLPTLRVAVVTHDPTETNWARDLKDVYQSRGFEVVDIPFQEYRDQPDKTDYLNKKLKDVHLLAIPGAIAESLPGVPDQEVSGFFEHVTLKAMTKGMPVHGECYGIQRLTQALSDSYHIGIFTTPKNQPSADDLERAKATGAIVKSHDLAALSETWSGLDSQNQNELLEKVLAPLDTVWLPTDQRSAFLTALVQKANVMGKTVIDDVSRLDKPYVRDIPAAAADYHMKKHYVHVRKATYMHQTKARRMLETDSSHHWEIDYRHLPATVNVEATTTHFASGHENIEAITMAGRYFGKEPQVWASQFHSTQTKDETGHRELIDGRVNAAKSYAEIVNSRGDQKKQWMKDIESLSK